MNKLPSTRLDDRLNAVLIGLAATALLVLTLDAARDDRAQTAATTQQASTGTAPAAAADSTTAMASITAER